eukprot:6469773-Amphidinium_carterae.1
MDCFSNAEERVQRKRRQTVQTEEEKKQTKEVYEKVKNLFYEGLLESALRDVHGALTPTVTEIVATFAKKTEQDLAYVLQLACIEKTFAVFHYKCSLCIAVTLPSVLQ